MVREWAGPSILRGNPDLRNGVAVLALAFLTMAVSLGTPRLSPHEAIVAEVGREMIASGDFAVPTINGRPWLEKPPLNLWMVAALGGALGSVTEASSRLPSVAAAMVICLCVVSIASRRLGSTVGLLAGLIQATTPWLIVRGRLADADVMLAAVVAVAMLALDRLRSGSPRWRWVFFLMVGLAATVKGIVFGGVLIAATTVVLLLIDRDRATLRALLSPLGLIIVVALTLAWPVVVLRRYPEALSLWTVHLSDRLSASPSRFAGEGWLEYLGTPLVQTLPWTPFAAMGAWRSWRRARGERFGPDRLLWAWAVVPSAMVSMASVRNGHYLIHAMPPLSIWAALSLRKLGERLVDLRGWTIRRLRLATTALFAAIGLGWALGFVLIGENLNARSSEFAFYERVASHLREGEPLILLYDLDRDDPWDKAPYPTPFGPNPADLAARLYYLDKPATWRTGTDDLRNHLPANSTFAVILRERDEANLADLGEISLLEQGPTTRWDRTFRLVRISHETGPR